MTAAAEHLGRPHRSDAVEDYAKAIYALERRAAGVPVTTNALAERLGVTPASASAMVKRLDELGYATHVPYHGVRLTEEGLNVALETMRHHRLLELYLAEHLGVPWDQVHAEAEALEHVISEDLERRIAEKLGNPTHDPHGDPIPGADFVIDEGETVSLADVAVGGRGRFARVSDSDPAMLRYLEQRGITIGLGIEVIACEPFEGPTTISCAGTETVLGGQLIRAMRLDLA